MALTRSLKLPAKAAPPTAQVFSAGHPLRAMALCFTQAPWLCLKGLVTLEFAAFTDVGMTNDHPTHTAGAV